MGLRQSNGEVVLNTFVVCTVQRMYFDTQNMKLQIYDHIFRKSQLQLVGKRCRQVSNIFILVTILLSTTD